MCSSEKKFASLKKKIRVKFRKKFASFKKSFEQKSALRSEKSSLRWEKKFTMLRKKVHFVQKKVSEKSSLRSGKKVQEKSSLRWEKKVYYVQKKSSLRSVNKFTCSSEKSSPRSEKMFRKRFAWQKMFSSCSVWRFTWHAREGSLSLPRQFRKFPFKMKLVGSEPVACRGRVCLMCTHEQHYLLCLMCKDHVCRCESGTSPRAILLSTPRCPRCVSTFFRLLKFSWSALKVQ